MSDIILISKTGLYETIKCAICKNPNQTERGCDGSCQYDKELHAKIVEAVTGIAEQRPHGEWIPCSERLPEEAIDHLGWIERDIWVDGDDYPKRKKEIAIGWHIEGRWHFDGYTGKTKCIAWMPLPDPPKGGDS